MQNIFSDIYLDLKNAFCLSVPDDNRKDPNHMTNNNACRRKGYQKMTTLWCYLFELRLKMAPPSSSRPPPDNNPLNCIFLVMSMAFDG